jgi:ribosomal protein S28E/S33
VNGADVADGDVVNVDPHTAAVDVVALATDPNATVEVVGGDALALGDNTITVTVTAADVTTSQTYTVTVNVAASSDTTIQSMQVDGNDVAAGEIYLVAAGTTDVAVDVVTTDDTSTVDIAGNTGLVAGDNAITVLVTAQDGSTQNYDFVVRVGGQSADVALTALTVNGQDATSGSITLPALTKNVTVLATPRDAAATVKIVGRTGLVTGANTITVTVTAADHITMRDYVITATVLALSNNTNLSTFTVNGSVVTDGGSINLAPGSTSAQVAAVAADASATVAVSGKSKLVPGANTLTVTVTAADGTVRIYQVTLNVLVLSSDATLSGLTFNGQDVLSTPSINVPFGTSSVAVAATTSNAYASVVVSGANKLQAGNNTVTVTVVAQDGTKNVYTATVTVLKATNTSLVALAVNGKDLLSGADTYYAAQRTTDVAVKVATSDPNATFTVNGKSGLVSGQNTLTVVVTAADGSTTQTYTRYVYVTPLSTDSSLTTFAVNGSSLTSGSTVVLPAATSSVKVAAVARDSRSSVTITGDTNLQTGNNTLTATVIAQDGISTTTYTATLVVRALSADTSLSTLTANGNAVDQSNPYTLTVPNGTTSVDVVATATDANATVQTTGTTGLHSGANTVNVYVTAQNGTKRMVTFTVNVELSADSSLSVFTINGQDVRGGGTIVVAPRTGAVLVKAATTDSAARFTVSGFNGLVDGSNTVTVTATAQNGQSTNYTATVIVTKLSSDASLASAKVDGVAIVDGSTYARPFGTTAVNVALVANDAGASTRVAGTDGLKTGLNTVIYQVIAANGAIENHKFFVLVAKSSNTALTSFTVNGQDASAGVISLPARTSIVPVKAIAQDPAASVVVTGNTALVAGDNTITVVVTAADQTTTRTYTATVNVAALSSNKSLSALTINGVDKLTDSSAFAVDHGVALVNVVARAQDSAASVAVVGTSSLVDGDNTVTITVTAADGSSATVQRIVSVARLSSDSSLSSAANAIAVNGVDVSQSRQLTLPVGTTAVTISAKPNDALASYKVLGATGLSAGDNTATVRVFAQDGSSSDYSVTLTVKSLSTNASLAAFTINQIDMVYGGLPSIDVAAGTNSVLVAASAVDPTATVKILGATGLTAGANTITVRITAAAGNYVDYTKTVNVAALSANVGLATFTINGVDVSNMTFGSSFVTVAKGTKAVRIVAKAIDASASVTITGKTLTDLSGGYNTVTVTVKAVDGTTKQYSEWVKVNH